MKIKHYLITRWSNVHGRVMPKDFLSEERLSKKLTLYKNYTYRSLQAQTNKNFTSILVVHDDIPINILKELKALSKESSFLKVVKHTEYKGIGTTKYIQKEIELEDYEFLVTSRLDDDDMLYCNGIKDIQDSINENTLIKYFGFENGCTLDLSTGEYFKFNRKSKVGMIGIGVSMVVNLKKYGILPYSVYHAKHTTLREDFLQNKIKELNKVYPLPQKYLDSTDFWEPKKTSFPAWVYIRHPQSKSTAIGRRIHYTNIAINEEVIHEKFLQYS